MGISVLLNSNNNFSFFNPCVKWAYQICGQRFSQWQCLAIFGSYKALLGLIQEPTGGGNFISLLFYEIESLYLLPKFRNKQT